MSADVESGPLAFVAEYPDEPTFRAAGERLRDLPFTARDSFTPSACEISLSPPSRPNRIRPLMACGFCVGAAVGFGMQAWATAVSYPLNSGGRPLVSWQAYFPVSFEIGILVAAIVGAVAFVVEARLWRINAPVFEAASAARASGTSFLLAVRPTQDDADPLRLVEETGALTVERVPL